MSSLIMCIPFCIVVPIVRSSFFFFFFSSRRRHTRCLSDWSSDVCSSDLGALRHDRPVVSLAKGVEVQTFLRPTEILQQVVGTASVAVLSGPSHAEEVSRGDRKSVV